MTIQPVPIGRRLRRNVGDLPIQPVDLSPFVSYRGWVLPLNIRLDHQGAQFAQAHPRSPTELPFGPGKVTNEEFYFGGTMVFRRNAYDRLLGGDRNRPLFRTFALPGYFDTGTFECHGSKVADGSGASGSKNKCIRASA